MWGCLDSGFKEILQSTGKETYLTTSRRPINYQMGGGLGYNRRPRPSEAKAHRRSAAGAALQHLVHLLLEGLQVGKGAID